MLLYETIEYVFLAIFANPKILQQLYLFYRAQIRKIMRYFHLFIISYALSSLVPQVISAQDSLGYQLTILTKSPKNLIDGYAYHFEKDTLWLVSNFGPLKSNATIDPYAAEKIVSLWLPTGVKQKSNFGTGIALGTVAGLAVGLITTPKCEDSVFGLCELSRGSHILGSTLIGALSGTIAGLLIRTEKRQTDRFIIQGNPELLRERKADIERLSKHTAGLSPGEKSAAQ